MVLLKYLIKQPQKPYNTDMKDENLSKLDVGNGEGESLTALYNRAFTEYGTHALWNVKQLDDPSPHILRRTAHRLRVEGDLDARRLAERIEKALLHANL